MSTQERYKERGVSAAKEEVHEAIKGLSKGLFPKAFCKILPDIAAGDEKWCNVMHADTAGTKPSLAYAYWKETGDNSVWKGIIQDALVMNLDDLLCVGITQDVIFSSTIGRNKNLIPGSVVKALIQGTNELLEEWNQWGLNLVLAGGETADVGDIVRTLDVGFTAFARMERSKVIDNASIQAGDVIVGLASFGQTSYESFYNGGMGSNGLTSARHDVFNRSVAEKYPDTYDHHVPQELVYCGKYNLTDTVEGLDRNMGQMVLSPTRTYTPVVKKVLDELPDEIHGMVHCSGGGQTKILHFMDNLKIVKDNLFETPPLFRIIQEASGTNWKEMYKVFNMGHRMELYVSPNHAQAIIDIAQSFDLEAKIVGYCLPASEKSLEIHSSHGKFEY